MFQIPSTSLVVGFGGTLLTVLGAALLSSAAVVVLVWLLAPVTRRLFGLEGRLAPRNLINSLSRTSVAVTALMVAVAVTIGVGIMIDGFRNTVVLWMEQTLQSDIYLSAPTFTATTPSSPIDPGILARLEHLARRAAGGFDPLDHGDGAAGAGEPARPCATRMWGRSAPL